MRPTVRAGVLATALLASGLGCHRPRPATTHSGPADAGAGAQKRTSTASPRPPRYPTIARGKPRGFELHIDQDRHRSNPTPIAALYLREIRGAANGDRLIVLQKALRHRAINAALVAAALRGVQVLAVHRQELSPQCPSYPSASEREVCGRIFRRSRHPHHKSLVLLKRGGTARAIIGSYNARWSEWLGFNPRTHTAIFFEVPDGGGLFAFFRAEADRMLAGKENGDKVLRLLLPGGELTLTMHPSPANPALDLLEAVRSCGKSPVWLSYYGLKADSAIGRPVFRRLGQLRAKGCDVRVLADGRRSNRRALRTLKNSRIDARRARFPTGKALLGHKLILARTGDQALILQSSANLSRSHHRRKHNLTLVLRGRRFVNLYERLSRELQRYWTRR